MKWDPLSAINICGPFYKIHTFYMQPHHHQSCYQPGGGAYWGHEFMYLCTFCLDWRFVQTVGSHTSWRSLGVTFAPIIVGHRSTQWQLGGWGPSVGTNRYILNFGVIGFFQSLRMKENVLDIVCTYKLTTRAHRGAFLTRSTLRSVVVVNKNLTCT